MAEFDWPLATLRQYRPELPEPADFDDFWQSTLADARRVHRPPRTVHINSGLLTVDVFDVRFSGYGGDPIAAWWQLPSDSEIMGVVIEFRGYSMSRGAPHDTGPFPLAGYGRLVVDTRGQGWEPGSGGGSTPDPHGAGSHVPGFLTQGIEDPSRFYYRRAFTDAALAVDTARALAPDLPVFVTGGSQGGGLAIAAAALSEGVAAAMPDVPFLCDFPRATRIVDTSPYVEVAGYLSTNRDAVDRAFATLSYFDCAKLAERATCPALFSVGLMDTICPPSTVFAAFNAWGSGDKRIEVYPFNGHEGGAGQQRGEQLGWLRERIQR